MSFLDYIIPDRQKSLLEMEEAKRARASRARQLDAGAVLLGGTTGQFGPDGQPIMREAEQVLYFNATNPEGNTGYGSTGQQLFGPNLLGPARKVSLLDDTSPLAAPRQKELLGQMNPQGRIDAFQAQQAMDQKRAQIASLPIPADAKEAMYAELQSAKVGEAMASNLKTPDAAKNTTFLVSKIKELGGPDSPQAQPYFRLLQKEQGIENDPNKISEMKARIAASYASADASRASADKTRGEQDDYGQRFKRRFGTDVPPGMRPEIGANGEPTGNVVPLAGGDKDPATIEAAKTRAKMEAFPNVTKAYDSTIAGFNDTIGVIDEMLAPKKGKEKVKPDDLTEDDYALSEGLGDITGFGGTWLGDNLTLPGGDAAKVRAKHNRVVASAFITGLQDLKSSSPNGASGLGATSETEGKKVADAKAEVDRTQGTPDYIAALRKYRSQVDRSKKIIQDAYNAEFGSLKAQPAQQPGQQPAQTPAQTSSSGWGYMGVKK